MRPWIILKSIKFVREVERHFIDLIGNVGIVYAVRARDSIAQILQGVRQRSSRRFVKTNSENLRLYHALELTRTCIQIDRAWLSNRKDT